MLNQFSKIGRTAPSKLSKYNYQFSRVGKSRSVIDKIESIIKTPLKLS